MELDAFTERLGQDQGRVAATGGAVNFALGDLEPGWRADLAVGDYVEVVQTLDITGVALVRVRGSLRVPRALDPALAWEVAVVADGAPAARIFGLAGRTRTLTDLAANVSKLTGAHEVGVRLTLTKAP
jgi:hypothetical protein